MNPTWIVTKVAMWKMSEVWIKDLGIDFRLVWCRYIHYWNWYKSGTISSPYKDLWSQCFKNCLKPKFEGLIKNVWSLNIKVLKIMYKTTIDVCSTTYNFKFTNYYSKYILRPLGPLHAHQVTMFQWRKLIEEKRQRNNLFLHCHTDF
jgi:hypothetical protein